MHRRSLLALALIATIPTAALAADVLLDVGGAPPDPVESVAGRAILGTAALEVTERRGAGAGLGKLDYLAGLADTAAVYHRVEVVPEPTTGLLLLLGLSGLALRRR